MKKIFFGSIILISFGLQCFGQHTRPARLTDRDSVLNKLINRSWQANSNNRLFYSNNNNRTASCSNDSLVFTRQSQVDSFPITNPDCTVLRYLTIDGTNASPAITHLDSLKYITDVTLWLQITHTSVTDLAELANLSFASIFQVTSNPLMTNVTIPSLQNVNLIFIDILPSLTSLSGFTNNLTVGSGTGVFIGQTGLTTLTGLEGLDTIGSLNIIGNPLLQSLQGLQNLSSCDYGIYIFANDVLDNVSALAQLTGLPYGPLEVSYNNTLNNLTGLGNISLIGGGFWFVGNGNLTSLSGLNNNLVIQNDMQWDAYDSILIEDNPQLEACSFPPICHFLNTNGHAKIRNNAPGCNSYTEVQAACPTCTGVLKTWIGASISDWEDSTNWSPVGVPGSCDTVWIASDTTNYPRVHSDITIAGLNMRPGSALDMNGFNLTINGDIKLDTIHSIGSGNIINVNNPIDVDILSSTLFLHQLNITGYKGHAYIFRNYFNGDVTLVDDPERDGGTGIGSNTINGNLSVTANTSHSGATSSVSSTGGDFIYGDASFTINNPVYFSIGFDLTRHLDVCRNLIINSNFTGYPQLNYLRFTTINSPNTAHITNLGSAPISIGGMIMDKWTNTQLILDQDVSVANYLFFNNGDIVTAPDKLLILKNGISVNYNTTSSVVIGPLKKIGNQIFAFPLGDIVNDTTWRALSLISAPSQATDAFTMQYFHRNPTSAGYDTSLHVPSLQKIQPREYWMLNRDNGNSNVQVQLGYDTLRSGSFSATYDLRVANWNGSQWLNNGNGGVYGNLAAGNVSSGGPVSSFGPFAIALAPHHLPVITVNTDSIACTGHSFSVPYTVDSLMFSINTFRVQLSDSSGSFANPTYIGQLASDHSGTIGSFIQANIPAGNNYKIRIVGDFPADTSNAKPVVLHPFPNPGIVVHGPSVGCVGGGIYKYWVTPAQPNIIYNWSISSSPNGIGTFTTNNDTAYVTWNGSGFAGVTVVNANVCMTGTTAFINVTVSQPAPTATPVLTNTGRWLYSSAPPANQNVLGYHWYRNDTLITGATNSSYYASNPGSYTVKYYNLCNDGPASNVISFAAASVFQTINFVSIPDKTYGDPSFTIPASASSGLPVSFNIVTGPGNIPGNVYNITGTGLVTIKARQPGDNIFDTAAPVLQSFTVNKAAQDISFPAIADRNYGVTAFNLNASSSSGLTILYSVVSGPAIVSGNTVTLTGVGTVTIRASQPGDTNYLAASPVDRSFCVRVSSLNPISGPVSICPTINATYSVNNISGATYTWRIVGGSTLSSTTSSVTTIWLSPGTYTLIVSAAGNCGAASTNDSLTITAITSVDPDSVNTMLPANDAIDQQLPLTLSWIPAHPNLFYTYDLYLWRSDQSQPSTPNVSNLTSVNYTIPLNSGLSYGYTYKWMIAAHNGSCVATTGGPIQTFALIPLPDLEVYNVNAPSTALSGQPISVTWKVKNNGPGNTQLNQHWTDAVFITVDSFLRFRTDGDFPFPFGPMLVATKANVTALNTGQFYNDTATFAVPVTYGGPLYMHVVTNYAPPVLNPVLENTRVNDTAHALPLTTVTLSPQPDLRVDTVINPNNTFSGSTINVTYKVKNYNVNASGSWFDRIYISKDAIFNINTATPLKYPNGTGSYYPASDVVVSHTNGLQQDSSYIVNTQVVVPNFIFGEYYIYVFTNANANLYEGPNNNNNVNHGNLLQVFLTATPKLTPANIFLSSNISITQSVPISWSIQNQGAYDNLQKNQGHYYVRDYSNVTVCTPGYISYRDSLSYGSSYWVDRVYLSTDSTGLNIPASVLLNEFSHNSANNYVPVGLLPNITCTNTIPSGQNTGFAIQLNSSHPGIYGYTVPSNLPQGDYYIYVYANPTKAVYEYPGTAEITRSNKITVSWPDLTVPSVTVPATGNSGQPLTVNYTILNAAPGAVYNHYRKDYIYMGNTSTFDGSCVLLDSIIYTSASVPVNVSQSLQKAVTLPNGLSGSKYIFVKTNTDSSFKETNLNNNINTTGAPVIISLTPPANLQVTSVALADTVFSVFGFPFKYTVTNNGSGLASGTWKDSLFISCSNSFSSSTAYFICVRTQQNYIPALGSYSDSFNLAIPLTFVTYNAGCMVGDTAHVYFFVKTNANNGLYEPANNNNTGISSLKTVINPMVDHTLTSVSCADTASVGRYFKINWSVKNLGLNPGYPNYYSWTDDMYFTSDSLGNNAQLLSFKIKTQPLNHNQSYNDSITFLMPNMPAGYYYLFSNTNCNNEIQAEHNLSNNLNLRRNASGQAIRVYLSSTLVPDLTDSILSGPSSAAVGQPVKIVYQVKNSGAATTNANSWYDDIWLSNSFQFGGLYLGTRNHYGALAVGQSYIDSFNINIPPNQVPGNYVLIIRANGSISFYEPSYNNNLAFHLVSVYTPAPSDLVVNTITAADTLILGNTAAINWNLDNTSDNPSYGYETDGIYLSSDSLVNSNNNILIGTKQNQLNILPLGSSSFNALPAVGSVTEGSYYLKVKTDILNNILETNKLNNTGVRSNKVYVKVKQLPMNVSTSDTLRPAYLYYKLIVPAALSGKTIQVKLTSTDSTTATNQMYIGLGYLPSAAHFDYTYNNASYGNQQITIESVVDSVYYIAAKGTKPNAAYQVIHLLAVELPFAILNVNANHGGNTGNVTVQIKGSLFTNNMIARIHSASTNVNASTIYFVNSTMLYATFNLSGTPLGVYDVILKKPDSSAATLASGFTVEATNNGGLITGSGPNTGQSGSGNAPGCDPGASSGLNSQLQTEVIIPPTVFASWPFIIQINYTNTSNVDIPAQARIFYSLDGSPLAFTEAGLAEGKTRLYIEFKDANGPPNTIRAGGTGSIKIYSKAPVNATAHQQINYTME